MLAVKSVLRPQKLFEYKIGASGWVNPANRAAWLGKHWVEKERWVLRPLERLCIQVWGLRPLHLIEKERWVPRSQELYEYKYVASGPGIRWKRKCGSSGPKNCYVYKFGGLRPWHWMKHCKICKTLPVKSHAWQKYRSSTGT